MGNPPGQTAADTPSDSEEYDLDTRPLTIVSSMPATAQWAVIFTAARVRRDSGEEVLPGFLLVHGIGARSADSLWLDSAAQVHAAMARMRPQYVDARVIDGEDRLALLDSFFSGLPTRPYAYALPSTEAKPKPPVPRWRRAVAWVLWRFFLRGKEPPALAAGAAARHQVRSAVSVAAARVHQSMRASKSFPTNHPRRRRSSSRGHPRREKLTQALTILSV